MSFGVMLGADLTPCDFNKKEEGSRFTLLFLSSLPPPQDTMSLSKYAGCLALLVTLVASLRAAPMNPKKGQRYQGLSASFSHPEEHRQDLTWQEQSGAYFADPLLASASQQSEQQHYLVGYSPRREASFDEPVTRRRAGPEWPGVGQAMPLRVGKDDHHRDPQGTITPHHALRRTSQSKKAKVNTQRDVMLASSSTAHRGYSSDSLPTMPSRSSPRALTSTDPEWGEWNANAATSYQTIGKQATMSRTGKSVDTSDDAASFDPTFLLDLHSTHAPPRPLTGYTTENPGRTPQRNPRRVRNHPEDLTTPPPDHSSQAHKEWFGVWAPYAKQLWLANRNNLALDQLPRLPDALPFKREIPRNSRTPREVLREEKSREHRLRASITSILQSRVALHLNRDKHSVARSEYEQFGVPYS
jgi:hypothetical protein